MCLGPCCRHHRQYFRYRPLQTRWKGANKIPGQGCTGGREVASNTSHSVLLKIERPPQFCDGQSGVYSVIDWSAHIADLLVDVSIAISNSFLSITGDNPPKHWIIHSAAAIAGPWGRLIIGRLLFRRGSGDLGHFRVRIDRMIFTGVFPLGFPFWRGRGRCFRFLRVR